MGRELSPLGSWKASFRFCARIGTINHPPHPPFGHPLPLRGGEGRGEGAVHGKRPFAFAHASGPYSIRLTLPSAPLAPSVRRGGRVRGRFCGVDRLENCGQRG